MSAALLLAVVASVVTTVIVPGSAAGAVAPMSDSAASGKSPPAAFLAAAFLPVRDGPSEAVVPGSVPVPGVPAGSLSVLVTLRYNNQTTLNRLLSGLEDPSSADYHRYLSAPAFTSEFGLSRSSYDQFIGYVLGQGVLSVTSYPTRTALSFRATPQVAGAVFRTTIGEFESDGGSYLAPLAPPELPASLAREVAAVEGLGTSPAGRLHLLGGGADTVGTHATEPLLMASGYLAPVTVAGGVQMIYPTDLQVAYDEQTLLDKYGAPTNATAAVLMWDGSFGGPSAVAACGGTLSAGADVGPYDPGDISDFFNSTSPSGQPHARVFSVLAGTSVSPGCLASWDTTGTVLANTAELETLGSTAPGAQIYAVSDVGTSIATLDLLFTTVLSPPSTLPSSEMRGLGNVSVVDVGWGTTDTTDATWSSDLQLAEARGVSVVAASGDSGDNPASVPSIGGFAEFPGSAGNNTTGSLVVGGTTLTLNNDTLSAGYLHVTGQIAWNVSATAPGGPRGSSGGVSSVYPEPPWQKASRANNVLNGLGRGTPDVAAIANNTLVTISVNGTRLNATNVSVFGARYRYANGTEVASAATAGLVTEIDYVLRSAANPVLGFVDPTLYPIANRQYGLLPGAKTFGHYGTQYLSPLPLLPFNDTVAGRNDKYAAGPGYDLVTGWGSLDAYNFTMYVLSLPTAWVPGELTSVTDYVNVTSLAATSPADLEFNSSIQQDVVLADPLGAPIYEVQCVVELNRTVSGSWTANFTAWLSFPFEGFYPTPVYEYYWPVPGGLVTFPLSLNVTTTLAPATALSPSELEFSFGNVNAVPLALEVYGAAFIIGAANYSYDWQGTTYLDGPLNGLSAPHLLSPQLDLVGGRPQGVPIAGAATFESGTAGNVVGYVRPSGSTALLRALGGVVTTSDLQSPESASNLAYVLVSSRTWQFSYSSGQAGQGVYSVEPALTNVTFEESGAPASSTWFANLTGGGSYGSPGTRSSFVVGLPVGVFSWRTGISLRNWSSTPPSGTVVVTTPAPMQVALVFAPSNGVVVFTVVSPFTKGQLPFTWYVNISGEPSWSGTGVKYTSSVTYGTHSYHLATSNSSWAPTRPTGNFTTGLAPVPISVTIKLVTYRLNLVFDLAGGISPLMTVRIGNHSRTGYLATYFAKEPNGSYTWSVSGLSAGYVASPSSGSFFVDGKGPYIVTVKVSGPPKPGGLFGLGLWGDALGGGIAATGVVAVVYWLRRRRARGAGRATSRSDDGSEAPAEPSEFDEP